MYVDLSWCDAFKNEHTGRWETGCWIWDSAYVWPSDPAVKEPATLRGLEWGLAQHLHQWRVRITQTNSNMKYVSSDKKRFLNDVRGVLNTAHTQTELCYNGKNKEWEWTLIRATAREKTLLLSFGISHIINAAHGPHHIDTGADFYSNTNIQYYGVEASDNRNFDMTPFFYPTAAFIHDALNQQRKTPRT